MDDSLENFIKENEYLYARAYDVNYEEFRNILVILDNGKWNDYNFESLRNLSHPKCNKSVLIRTQK